MAVNGETLANKEAYYYYRKKNVFYKWEQSEREKQQKDKKVTVLETYINNPTFQLPQMCPLSFCPSASLEYSLPWILDLGMVSIFFLSTVNYLGPG